MGFILRNYGKILNREAIKDFSTFLKDHSAVGRMDCLVREWKIEARTWKPGLSCLHGERGYSECIIKIESTGCAGVLAVEEVGSREREGSSLTFGFLAYISEYLEVLI